MRPRSFSMVLSLRSCRPVNPPTTPPLPLTLPSTLPLTLHPTRRLKLQFPAINVAKIKLEQCKRVVLFHYDAESDNIEFRQFAVRVRPSGVSRRVSRLLRAGGKRSLLPGAVDLESYILGESVPVFSGGGGS